LASYAKAQQLFEQVGAKLGQANVLKAIGDVQYFRKEIEAALASYAKAQQLFEQVGAKLGQANVYLALGRLKNDAADFEMAIQLYEQIRDGYSIARGKFYYAISLAESGEIERAKLLLAEARPLWAAIQFDQGVQLIDGQLAQLADGS
jgi:tetratricopeptide (TPR) repeat protein